MLAGYKWLISDGKMDKLWLDIKKNKKGKMLNVIKKKETG